MTSVHQSVRNGGEQVRFTAPRPAHEHDAVIRRLLDRVEPVVINPSFAECLLDRLRHDLVVKVVERLVPKRIRNLTGSHHLFNPAPFHAAADRPVIHHDFDQFTLYRLGNRLLDERAAFIPTFLAAVCRNRPICRGRFLRLWILPVLFRLLANELHVESL